MNDGKNQAPFQKVMSELQLLKMYLMENEKTETARNVTSDIEVLINVMGLCMHRIACKIGRTVHSSCMEDCEM